jgi:hypothetical protein
LRRQKESPSEPPEKSEEPKDGAVWQDRPDQNRDEPTICLFDVIFWLMEVEPSVVREYEIARAEADANKAWAIAFDKAEQIVRSAIKGRRLVLYGYPGEDPSALELEQIPSAAARGLQYTMGGQPDWDRHEYGRRPYGRGSFEHPKTTTEARGWTGLCFEKADILAVIDVASPTAGASHRSASHSHDPAEVPVQDTSEEAVIAALSKYRATRKTRFDEEEEFLRETYGESLIGVRGGVRGHVIRCRQAKPGKAGRPPQIGESRNSLGCVIIR